MSYLRAGMIYRRSKSRVYTVYRATRRVFAAIAWISLSACTTSYQPRASGLAPQPLPVLSLIQAEQKGYAEGLAAGERIQARRDRAAEAAKRKQSAPPSTEGGAPAGPAEATPPLPAVKTQPPPEFSFSPAGPAIAVAPVAQTGCKKSNGTLCD
jgi:hypothetical protein